MSSPTLDELIDIGNDLRGMKYYEVAAAAIIFYDYFLTLADEITYAWHGRKSWVFAIFLVNRYLPMAYQLWLMYTDFSPIFPQQLYDRNSMTSRPPSLTRTSYRCNKTAFFSGFTFIFSTFLAQVVLTMRIYAVSHGSRIITTWLGSVTVSQFILGLYFIIHGALRGAQQVVLPTVDAYKICVLSRNRPVEIGFTSLSLLYDLTAFSLIVYLVLRSNRYQRRMPLLRTIAQDATSYFLIIFTSHFALELTLFAARPTLQLVPAAGNVVFLPVMITRLMLSLRKVNASREDTWTLGQPTTQTARFAEYRGVPDTTGSAMRLDTFAATREGARSRA